MKKRCFVMAIAVLLICAPVVPATASGFVSMTTDLSSGAQNAVNNFIDSILSISSYKDKINRASTPQDWYNIVMDAEFQNNAVKLVNAYNTLKKYTSFSGLVSVLADDVSIQDAILALLDRADELMAASSSRYWSIISSREFLQDIINFIDSYNNLPDSIDWGWSGGSRNNSIANSYGYSIGSINPSIEMNPSSKGTTFWAANMFDGIDTTCWQYRVKDGNVSAYIQIDFEKASDVAWMWIKNGFWKITNGYDQYTRNSRPRMIELSFKYSGSSQYKNPITITLYDDTTRRDWQKHEFNTQYNVISIRFRVLSIYTGTKFPKDVAVSELAFYGP